MKTDTHYHDCMEFQEDCPASKIFYILHLIIDAVQNGCLDDSSRYPAI
jgi:hypothetical protein